MRFGGLSRAFGDATPTRCPSSCVGAPGIPLREGCDGLEALRRATRKNPWFAVVSGVVHGGEVSYEGAQAVGEFLASVGAENLTTEAAVSRALLDPSLPVGAGRGITVVADRIAAAAAAYARIAPSLGRVLTRADIDRITYAVCAECRPPAQRRAIERELGPAAKTGIGRKAGALMREYLGDDEAVAVDRHIMNYTASVTGKLGVVVMAKIPKEERDRLVKRPDVIAVERRQGSKTVDLLYYSDAAGVWRPFDIRPWRKGDTIGPKEFALGERVIRGLAHQCGVTPAAFQVAAWLQSACMAKGRGVGYSLPLTGGARFRCGDILKQPAIPGLSGLGNARVSVVEVELGVWVTV